MTKRNKNRVVTAVTAIVLFVLIAGAVGVAAWLTNGFKDEIKAFGLTVNGITYVNDAEGLVLEQRTVVTVTSPLSDDCGMSVYPKAAEEDFAFSVGDEEYMWSDTYAMSFTPGFDITVQGKTYTLTYEDLEGIIAGALSYPREKIRVMNTPPGDLFELRVTCGGRVISLGFSLGKVAVESVNLDVTEIVF